MDTVRPDIVSATSRVAPPCHQNNEISPSPSFQEPLEFFATRVAFFTADRDWTKWLAPKWDANPSDTRPGT